jgi:ABC-type Na+ transport system ATPase subunit NatA
MSQPSLLAARDLRIDVGGAVAIERATFETTGRSAVVAGDAGGLLAAVQGTASVQAGTLSILGMDVADDDRRGRLRRIGLAPFEPPMPERYLAVELLVASARLSGLGAGEARRSAERVLRDVGLDALGGHRVSGLGRPYRRGLVLAQAAVASPDVLIASAPLAGLSGSEAEYVTHAFHAVVRDRAWIATVSSLAAGSPEHALCAAADEILVFASGRLVRQTSLRSLEKSATLYSLTIRGNVAAFREALRQRGVELVGGPQRFAVELPTTITPNDLLALSEQVEAPVLELRPQMQWKAEGS